MSNSAPFVGVDIPKQMQDYTLRNIYENRYHYPGNDLVHLGLLLARWFNCAERKLVSFNRTNYQITAQSDGTTLTLILTNLNNDTRMYQLSLADLNTYFINTYLKEGS